MGEEDICSSSNVPPDWAVVAETSVLQVNLTAPDSLFFNTFFMQVDSFKRSQMPPLQCSHQASPL